MSSIKIKIASPLRKFVGGRDEVLLAAKTVDEAITNLVKDFPLLGSSLFNQENKFHSFAGVYLNGKNIKTLQNLNTSVKDQDQLSIVIAVAGG